MGSIYLVLCDSVHEYGRILEKHRILPKDSMMINRLWERHKMYKGLCKLNPTKYEVTYRHIELIPDLWLWCNKKLIFSEYNYEKNLTSRLFDVARWKNYNKKLNDIVNEYYFGLILSKYEMITVYKLFRKMILASFDIANSLKTIKFLYDERYNGNIYDVDTILDRYIQMTQAPINLTKLTDIVNDKGEVLNG